MNQRNNSPGKPVPNPNHELLWTWLKLFQEYQRQRNFDAAEHLFHEKVIAFGLNENAIYGLKNLRADEWEVQWKNQVSFTLGLQEAKIVPHPSLLMVALPYSCRGLIVGSPLKNGRATIVLAVFDGKLLCVHCHFSESPNQPSKLLKAC